MDRNEQPVHEVTVPPFAIMRTKVTGCMIRRCLDAGRCQDFPDDLRDLPDWVGYIRVADMPEVAAWVGGGARLCSEAEWEFAARSGGLPFRYPWGNFPPTCAQLPLPEFCEPVECPTEECAPCSWPDYNTQQGVCNLVNEYVADTYHANYRGAPLDGSAWIDNGWAHRVLRGVSWGDPRVSSRWEGGGQQAIGEFRLCRTLDGPPSEPASVPGGASPFGGRQRVPSLPPPPAQRAPAANEGEEIPWYCTPQWVDIPGGSFLMGTDDPLAALDETPTHEVAVRPFQIMQAKATFCMVRRCVEAGVCDAQTPEGPLPLDREPIRDDHPLGLASFALAQQFAAWVGQGTRLCSEAEWEYAARSAGQLWTYPWGDGLDCTRVNGLWPSPEYPDIEGCGRSCYLGNWCPVCSRPEGNTIQGVCDMAGNSGEWVEDHYHPDYVGAPADGNPWLDPGAEADRVVRSGGIEAWTLRSTRRAHQSEESYDATAIRLCRSPQQR
ncbi:MAG: formylglycine-generating enzyme family protein [Polyangia bacterium]|nr:formylglycine-generating enzyme family protein [Polyangia bacterium]